METVLIALGIGVAIGYFNLIPQNLTRWTSYLTMSGLVVLLLTMGVKVGTNHKILANLGNLGVQAFILALFSVIFSVVFIILLDRYFINLDYCKTKKVGDQ